MTRPTLATPSLLRRHGDRRSAHHRSCYVVGDAGYEGFARSGPPVPVPVPVPVMVRPVAAVRAALARAEAVSDAELDQVFPEELRDRSSLHWTPVEVAIRAAQLLAPSADLRVLDVGAGPGKLCLVGALVSGAMWWGIEQDQAMVAAANHAAWALEISHRTRFVHGDGSQLAWDEFDAIYFYNPFGTLLLAPDASPFVRYATVQRTLRRIEQRLATVRAGTRVVTYHGFGGTLPAGYTLASREPVGGDALELWIRDRG